MSTSKKENESSEFVLKYRDLTNRALLDGIRLILNKKLPILTTSIILDLQEEIFEANKKFNKLKNEMLKSYDIDISKYREGDKVDFKNKEDEEAINNKFNEILQIEIVIKTKVPIQIKNIEIEGVYWEYLNRKLKLFTI